MTRSGLLAAFGKGVPIACWPRRRRVSSVNRIDAWSTVRRIPSLTRLRYGRGSAIWTIVVAGTSPIRATRNRTCELSASVVVRFPRAGSTPLIQIVTVSAGIFVRAVVSMRRARKVAHPVLSVCPNPPPKTLPSALGRKLTYTKQQLCPVPLFTLRNADIDSVLRGETSAAARHTQKCA